MGEQPDSFFEYLEANRGLLDSIARSANEHIAIDANRDIVVFDPETAELHIINGQVTPEDVNQDYARRGFDVTQTQAEDMAEFKNTMKKVLVFNEVDYLLRLASMAHRAQQHRDAANSIIEPPRFLAYGDAVWESTIFQVSETQSVEVSRTRLQDLEEYGTASSYVIESNDSEVTQLTQIFYLDDIPSMVGSRLRPPHDALFERAGLLMEDSLGELRSFFSGIYEDEETIDDKLAELWMKYLGSAKEIEVGAILDEIRQRAIAINESAKMDSMFDVSTPSVDQLIDVQTLLGA